MREEASFEDASWDSKRRTAEITAKLERKKNPQDFEMEEICGCMGQCAIKTRKDAKTSDLVRKGNVGAVKLETGGISRGKF